VGIAESTVKRHIHNILEKPDNRVQAVTRCAGPGSQNDVCRPRVGGEEPSQPPRLQVYETAGLSPACPMVQGPLQPFSSAIWPERKLLLPDGQPYYPGRSVPTPGPPYGEGYG
jgi:hypothetical protein